MLWLGLLRAIKKWVRNKNFLPLVAELVPCRLNCEVRKH